MNTLHSLGKEFTLFTVLAWLLAEGHGEDGKRIIEANLNYPDENFRKELQTISRFLAFGDNRTAAIAADNATRTWYGKLCDTNTQEGE